ncbi:PAS domain S-box protein [uncultured Desulfobacter sp.]|uniref:hybrid sensor histidine kinase/response regulator n=1 Tax=uncultured Desulfobacter sp. TaxID=240139 RepID=UPI002AAA7B1C|nr:PAS domain S-box protein [uncultured Desulfobacter sp.]
MNLNDPNRSSSDTKKIEDRCNKQIPDYELKYRLLFETVSDAIYLLSEKGEIIDVNKSACVCLGREKEEMLQLSINDVDQNFSADQFLAFWNEVPFNTLKQYESIHKLKNGDVIFVEITGQKFILENTTHYYIVAKDITKHQKSENALAESEKRFRDVMENVDAVAVQGYGLDGTTQYWNKASERLYGYTQQEAIGTNLLDLIIPPEMRDIVAKEMRGMAESGHPIPSGELSLLHKDGSQLPVISHHTIVKVPGREPELFCLDIDITHRKQAEAEKEKLQAQLNQAQKMEAVGRLAGGVAHDFNNMLSIILGNIEILEEDIAPDSPLLSSIHEVQKAAERSADLTRQLLAFARKQTIDPKVLDPNNTIEGMLKMLKRLIGEDIDLLWKPNEDLWRVKMDPSQIDQILANLCVNARDAIKDVGKITIETDNFCFDENYCRVHQGCFPGEFVLLCVSDNGSGMDKETMENLFDPFFTTKEKGQGTGLGLATVYGIVKQNDGFINVYSEPGQGTTFKIYIPRHEACQTESPVMASEKSLKGCETILLVEDEKSILNMTKMMLERLGYTVLPANIPEEAIQICNDYTGKIDLLITDVVMPSMNGRELSRTIMKAIPNIKCLYMSGYTSNAIAHRGILDDGLNFINKPFSKQVLSVKLREILDNEKD